MPAAGARRVVLWRLNRTGLRVGCAADARRIVRLNRKQLRVGCAPARGSTTDASSRLRNSSCPTTGCCRQLAFAQGLCHVPRRSSRLRVSARTDASEACRAFQTLILAIRQLCLLQKRRGWRGGMTGLPVCWLATGLRDAREPTLPNRKRGIQAQSNRAKPDLNSSKQGERAHRFGCKSRVLQHV